MYRMTENAGRQVRAARVQVYERLMLFTRLAVLFSLFEPSNPLRARLLCYQHHRLGRQPRTEDGIRHLHATRLYQHRRRARRRGPRFVPEDVGACSVKVETRPMQ